MNGMELELFRIPIGAINMLFHWPPSCLREQIGAGWQLGA
jgi:hypothetical protein